MKKSVIILFILISLMPLVLAANETTASLEGSEKAYSCLKNQLGDNCGNSASTEQTAFSILAMAYDSGIQGDCLDSLNSKKKDNCWGKTASDSCDIKSTSQAIIALKYVGKNVDDYVEWLEDKKKQTTGLTWFLEIDASEATSCKIKVNSANEKTFNINANKKISGTSSCLTPAENNYFLKISNSCLDSNFTISCDKNFVTTLIYKQSSGSTYYISSLTHSASIAGSTEEKVNAYCFGINSCDYEGSLWASIALAKTGEDISAYLPYLSSVYDNTANKKYFPSAFLYMITSEDDYQSDITGKQKQGKYWEESGNKFYDTALALSALQQVLIDEVGNAKDYLLSIQDSSGCWSSNNVRDTSFILYAAWPKNPVSSGDVVETRSKCTDFNHYCTAYGECTSENVLSNFYCSGLGDICCSTEPAKVSCEDKNGIVCPSGEQCTGSEVTASDTNYCCIDSCIEVSAATTCEENSNNCRTSCLSTEQETSAYECNGYDVCCEEKTTGGKSWTFIILLIILIILVILAIIFRNQLKIWWFRTKSELKFSRPPTGPSGRPPVNPPGFTSPMMIPTRPRQIIPRGNIPMRRPSMRSAPRRAEKDTLFDETMKKLKEMSK
ncbi:MAG: hypothetical protein PHH54_02945 [Candidatus Nanoarchaeia archaeon]|nr:hypothetical protein [Candidatus Nanoarchaeia archaeon]MDD5740917.1 hypothetical protein [Candidatus Nanoarchaeia archaeon]